MLGDVFGSFTTNIWLVAGGVWLFIIFIIILGNVVNRSRSSSMNKHSKKNNYEHNYNSNTNSDTKKLLKEQKNENELLHKELKAFTQRQDKLFQLQNDKFTKAFEEQNRQFEIKYSTLNERFENQKNANELLQLQNDKICKTLEENKRQFEIKYHTLVERFEKQGLQFDTKFNSLNIVVESQKKVETVHLNYEESAPKSSFHNAFSSYKSHNESATVNTFKGKGSLGEVQIHTSLIQNFGNENVFANLYLTRQDGNHSQVDLVLISYYGIYIIESKKWNGTVTGSDNDSHWSQTIVDDIKGIITNKYVSPTRQNYGHIKAFCECFNGIPENKVFSIVVFNNLCKLLVNSRTPVIHREDLVEFIKNSSINREKYFSDNDLKILRAEIKKYSNPSETIKKQHIDYCNSKKQ